MMTTNIRVIRSELANFHDQLYLKIRDMEDHIKALEYRAELRDRERAVTVAALPEMGHIDPGRDRRHACRGHLVVQVNHLPGSAMKRLRFIFYGMAVLAAFMASTVMAWLAFPTGFFIQPISISYSEATGNFMFTRIVRDGPLVSVRKATGENGYFVRWTSEINFTKTDSQLECASGPARVAFFQIGASDTVEYPALEWAQRLSWGWPSAADREHPTDHALGVVADEADGDRRAARSE